MYEVVNKDRGMRRYEWEGRNGKGGMVREVRDGRDGMGRKHDLCECTGENE